MSILLCCVLPLLLTLRCSTFHADAIFAEIDFLGHPLGFEAAEDAAPFALSTLVSVVSLEPSAVCDLCLGLALDFLLPLPVAF